MTEFWRRLRLALSLFVYVLRHGAAPDAPTLPAIEPPVALPPAVEPAPVAEERTNGSRRPTATTDRFQVWWVTVANAKRLRYVGDSDRMARRCYVEGCTRPEIVRSVFTDGEAITDANPNGIVESYRADLPEVA